jgi:hypothetical protein
MLLTAVSEAVERYDPPSEPIILLETDSSFQALILSPYGWDYVAGLELAPSTPGAAGIDPSSLLRLPAP